MKTKLLLLKGIGCAMLLLTACLKDSTFRTYTYTLYRPVYHTTAEVKAAVKNDVPKPVSTAGKMYVLGQYIFLNEPGKGIHVINNANPASPVNESFINIPGCEDMAAMGNTLYADCYTDMAVLDISNPKAVSLKKWMTNLFPERVYVSGFAMDSGKVITDWIVKDTTETHKIETGWRSIGGEYLYAAQDCASCNGGGLTKSNAPGVGGSMARFTIQQQHLYAVTPNSMQVLSLSSPQDPQWKNKIELGWGIETIYPFKDKLFIGSSQGMYIYTVANPSSPEKAGKFEHARVCDPVIADDHYAYVTLRGGAKCGGFTNQLDVVNISNIYAPSLVISYPLSNPRGLSKDGNWLFICDGADGLKWFDATIANSITPKGRISMAETYDVICINGIAIVSAKDGLYQYDYTNINQVKLISKIGLQQ